MRAELTHELRTYRELLAEQEWARKRKLVKRAFVFICLMFMAWVINERRLEAKAEQARIEAEQIKLFKKCAAYTNLNSQIKCIDLYIYTFPKGQHIQEALNQRVALLKQAEEEAWRIISKLSNATEKHAECEKYIRRFPNGVHIEKAWELISQLNEWQDVLKAYQGMIEQQELSSALSHLIEYSRTTEAYTKLKARFERDVLQVSEQKAKQKIALNLWKDALNEIEFYNSLPLDYQSSEGKAKWNDLRRKTHLNYDRVLYEAVRNNDQDALSYNAYINESTSGNIPGRMIRLVQNRYQCLQMSARDFTLRANKISDDCDLEKEAYTVNGSSKKSLSVTSYLTVAPADYLSINVSGYNDVIGWNNEWPTTTVSVQAQVLATQGKVISFTCENGTNDMYTVSFKGSFKDMRCLPWREWEGE